MDDFIRNNLDLAGDKADFHLVLIAFQAQAVRLFLTTKTEPGCQSLEQHSELQWIFLFTFHTPCCVSDLGALSLTKAIFPALHRKPSTGPFPIFLFPTPHSAWGMGRASPSWNLEKSAFDVAWLHSADKGLSAHLGGGRMCSRG